MLSLFSIEKSKSILPLQPKKSEVTPTDNKLITGTSDEILVQNHKDSSDAQNLSKSFESEVPPLWSTKVGRSRLFTQHKTDCECCIKPLPMQQSIDEMEWERGIWGLSNAGNSRR
jgi:hypothetical protein